MNVKFKKLHPLAVIPSYQTDGSAALDLSACFFGEVTEMVIPPNSRKLIPTGLAMAIPVGYMAIVSPRSGLAIKNGVTVTNSPGIIDSDYRGDIGVILENNNNTNFKVVAGDRIAQLTILPIEHVTLEQVEELDDTTRGTSGFGSTGV